MTCGPTRDIENKQDKKNNDMMKDTEDDQPRLEQSPNDAIPFPRDPTLPLSFYLCSFSDQFSFGLGTLPQQRNIVYGFASLPDVADFLGSSCSRKF